MTGLDMDTAFGAQKSGPWDQIAALYSIKSFVNEIALFLWGT